MLRRPRVLLLAEKANPDWISVPFVGWTHVEAIASFADVHLVTHVRNQTHILARGFPAQHVTFVSTTLEDATSALALRLEGKGAMGGATQTAFQIPMYYQFEHEAWRQLAPRLARREFDLVHRITPLSPALPSLFAPRTKRLGIPFIIGPLNGGVPWPAGVGEVRQKEGEWVSYLRDAHKLLPYYRATRRDAAAVIAGSAVAWREAVAVVDPERCFYLPENAVSPERFATVAEVPSAGPLPVAFAGRLVPFKGAEILLRAAIPLLRTGRITLDIVGDGPERPGLQALVEREQVGHAVRLDGLVPHTELCARLARSSVFAFPSVREFGGAVVMEAMMTGMVPLVADYGGPSEVVTDDTGRRVPLGNQEALVRGVRRALEELLSMPRTDLRAMGERARARALEHFTVAAKRDKTERIYDWVLGRGERPDLVPPAHSLALYERRIA